MSRTAVEFRGELARVHESLDQTMALLLEEARADGYSQALTDVNTALMQGMPALQVLLRLRMPPRPHGREIIAARREGAA